MKMYDEVYRMSQNHCSSSAVPNNSLYPKPMSAIVKMIIELANKDQCKVLVEKLFRNKIIISKDGTSAIVSSMG